MVDELAAGHTAPDNPMTAFQKDTVEDASVAFAQIASILDLVQGSLPELPWLADALGGAAAYARIMGERLDRLPVMN